MSDLRFGNHVRRVIRLTSTPSGETLPETLYERAREGKKKSSTLLKPAQRLVRRLVKAQEAAATKYLEVHARSNEKRRDGWVVDFPSNVARASRAGQKSLKIKRLLLG